jgi:hypothetical protein
MARNSRPDDVGDTVELAVMGGGRGPMCLRRFQLVNAGWSADFQGLGNGGLGSRHLGVPTWILSSWQRGSGRVPAQAFSGDRGQEECQPARSTMSQKDGQGMTARHIPEWRTVHALMRAA